MTIHVTKKFANLSSSPNEIYNLQTNFPSQGNVGAVSFVAEYTIGSNTSRKEIIESCAEAALEVFESQRTDVDLFFIGRTVSYNGVSNRRKDFWQLTDPPISIRSAVCRDLQQSVTTYRNDLQTTAVFEFNIADMVKLANWLRGSSIQGYLLVLPHDSLEEHSVLERVCSIGFNKSGMLDWDLLIKSIYQSENDLVLVRFSGNFDDRDCAVDLFYRKGGWFVAN